MSPDEVDWKVMQAYANYWLRVGVKKWEHQLDEARRKSKRSAEIMRSLNKKRLEKYGYRDNHDNA